LKNGKKTPKEDVNNKIYIRLYPDEKDKTENRIKICKKEAKIKHITM